MKRVLMLLAAACCVSCGLYSRYERPDLDVEYVETATLPSWQQIYTDPCLQSLVGTALENGQDFLTARLRVEEAQAALQRASSAFLPGAGLSGSADAASRKTSLSLTANWQPDLFGKLRNAKEYARASLQEREAAAQSVRSSLIAAVAASYYNLLILDKQLDISLKTLENWDKTITVLESLKLAGKTNDIAVLQAKAKKMKLESSTLSLRSNIAVAEHNLCALAGIEPQPVSRSVLPQDIFAEEPVRDIPLRAMASRPDVRQAENALAAAFYATAQARAAFYPDITLSGSGGWNNLDNLVWSAIGNLAAPLYNRGINKAGLKIAQAQQEAARIAFRQALIDAATQVADAHTGYLAARERIGVDTRQRDALADAVTKIELMMRYSTANYLEVLTAQQSLLDAELGIVSDQKDLISATISLYQSLGGGAAE